MSTIIDLKTLLPKIYYDNIYHYCSNVQHGIYYMYSNSSVKYNDNTTYLYTNSKQKVFSVNNFLFTTEDKDQLSIKIEEARNKLISDLRDYIRYNSIRLKDLILISNNNELLTIDLRHIIRPNDIYIKYDPVDVYYIKLSYALNDKE